MFRKPNSLNKQLLAATALALGASSVALADDNSMTRFGGESYAAFNLDKLVVSNAPSAFRQTNPHGLSIGEYQAMSSDGRPWSLPNPSDAGAYAAYKAPSTFRQDNPQGLSIRQYAAFSSDSPAWQLPTQPDNGVIASTEAGSVAKSVTNDPSQTGIARLFGFFHAGRVTSAN